LFTAAGAELLSFLVAGGAPFVAAGDHDNDGRAELFTSSGAPAKVQGFDGRSGAALASLDPFAGFSGPVSLSALDRDNDGRLELAAVATVGGSAHVKLFGPSQEVLDSFFIAVSGNDAAVVASV